MRLEILKEEPETELQEILAYWKSYTVDDKFGGFAGQLDWKNEVQPSAPKGAALNARILWTFSAAYLHTALPAYLEMATRAYDYISSYFIDKKFGGLFWSLNHLGEPIDTKKQVYAQAFGIYALSEYYKCKSDPKVLIQAISLYENLLEYALEKNMEDSLKHLPWTGNL